MDIKLLQGGKESLNCLMDMYLVCCLRLRELNVPCIVIYFFLNNQPDALIILIYSVTKLYMFRASSLPIIRSFLLYIRHR